MSSREKWDSTFINIAHLIAEHSTCVKSQVGALLVQNRRIISTGYNGTAPGFHEHCGAHFSGANFNDPDVLEEHAMWSSLYELHAESNALLFAAKHGISPEDATVYITMSPCVQCAKLLISAQVKRVVYAEEYRDTAGIKLLKTHNIQTELFVDKN